MKKLKKNLHEFGGGWGGVGLFSNHDLFKASIGFKKIGGGG